MPWEEFIEVVNVTFVDSTHLTGTVGIPEGASAGAHDVIVVNPNHQAGILEGGFMVNDPPTAPVIDSVTPSSGVTNSTLMVHLAGSNLVGGATVNLSRGGETDLTTTVGWLDQGNLTFALAIPAGTTPGAWNVVVKNPDGQIDVLAGGFTILDAGAAPVVTSIDPAVGYPGRCFPWSASVAPASHPVRPCTSRSGAG